MQPSPNSGSEHPAFAVGMLGNVLLALVKLGVGVWTGSAALVADGWNSMGDVLTTVGTWWAHRWGQEPPDEDHHYGHGNAEPLAGALVGGVLLATGAGVVLSAFGGEVGFESGRELRLALGAGVFSIFVNAALALFIATRSALSRSHALRALFRDKISDALASTAVVLAILASNAGWSWAEPVCAVLIGGVIAWMGVGLVRDGVGVLMDRVDPQVQARLRTTALGVEGVREVQRVRVHPVGSVHRVDMEISVDGTLSVLQGHEIAHSVERAVTQAHPDVVEVHVHVNPCPLDAAPGS